MKVITILGTRPEIIKLSPLLPLLDLEFNHILVHTGQHYDYTMDKVFFEELQLRKPDYELQVGSHPHGKQTGLMLEKIEEILVQEKPNLVVVLGDTNSTLAGALAAAKLFIPVMHVESGCRSFNREIPEEINKTVVPYLSEYLIAPDEICYNHLLQGGIHREKIFLLGSTVFDAVERNRNLIDVTSVLKQNGLTKSNFVLLTIHRAENTDNLPRLKGMIHAFNELAQLTTVVFPIHPRTRRIIAEHNLVLSSKIKVIEPKSYLQFLALLSSCTFCMSDSGGIQEESLVFNVPCVILRNETEWTRLVEAGKNILVGTAPEKIIAIATTLLKDKLELQKIKEREYPYTVGVSQNIIKVVRSIKAET